MGIVIDTDILIEFEKNRLDISSKTQGRESEEIFISVITASELLHGILRAKEERVRIRRSNFVEGILQAFPIIPINLNIARIHAKIWADLKSKGMMIGLHDSWIAATCIVYNYTLITRNTREFERVKGLIIESWNC